MKILCWEKDELRGSSTLYAGGGGLPKREQCILANDEPRTSPNKPQAMAMGHRRGPRKIRSGATPSAIDAAKGRDMSVTTDVTMWACLYVVFGHLPFLDAMPGPCRDARPFRPRAGFLLPSSWLSPLPGPLSPRLAPHTVQHTAGSVWSANSASVARLRRRAMFATTRPLRCLRTRMPNTRTPLTARRSLQLQSMLQALQRRPRPLISFLYLSGNGAGLMPSLRLLQQRDCHLTSWVSQPTGLLARRETRRFLRLLRQVRNHTQ